MNFISLKQIYIMLEEINKKMDDHGKIGLLKEYLSDPIFGNVFRKVLVYIASSRRSYKLKRINYCIYFDDKIAAEHQNVDSIFTMLDYLNEKTSDASDEEISFLEKISSSDVETVEVVVRILNKQSGCGLTNEQIVEILQEMADNDGYKENKQ